MKYSSHFSGWMKPATRMQAEPGWARIALDIARSHGGDITLDESPKVVCGRS